jgi:hypothetical protein
LIADGRTRVTNCPHTITWPAVTCNQATWAPDWLGKTHDGGVMDMGTVVYVDQPHTWKHGHTKRRESFMASRIGPLNVRNMARPSNELSRSDHDVNSTTDVLVERLRLVYGAVELDREIEPVIEQSFRTVPRVVDLPTIFV